MMSVNSSDESLIDSDGMQYFWMNIAGFDGYYFGHTSMRNSIIRLHGEAFSVAHNFGNVGTVLTAACSSPASTGSGRVVAFSHTCYADSPRHRPFLLSMVNWASEGATMSYTRIDKRTRGGVSNLPKTP